MHYLRWRSEFSPGWLDLILPLSAAAGFRANPRGVRNLPRRKTRADRDQPGDDPQVVGPGSLFPIAGVDDPGVRRMDEDVVDPASGGDRGPGAAPDREAV